MKANQRNIEKYSKLGYVEIVEAFREGKIDSSLALSALLVKLGVNDDADTTFVSRLENIIRNIDLQGEDLYLVLKSLEGDSYSEAFDEEQKELSKEEKLEILRGMIESIGSVDENYKEVWANMEGYVGAILDFDIDVPQDTFDEIIDTSFDLLDRGVLQLNEQASEILKELEGKL